MAVWIATINSVFLTAIHVVRRWANFLAQTSIIRAGKYSKRLCAHILK